METEIVMGSTRMGGLNVTSLTMLQIPQFARAVDFLSSNLCSFGIRLYQNDVKSDDDHALLRLLNRKSNQNQTSKSVLRQWYLDGEVHGNGYVYVRRESPTSPNVIGLYNLDSSEVTPFKVIPDGGTVWDAVYYYWHSLSKQAVPAADILHYRPGLSYDGWIGYAPQQLFFETFRRAQALQIFQTKYCVKGSMVKASIEVPVGTSAEQQKEIVSAMRQFRAESADRDMILLTGGATMKSQTAASQQLQLIEQDDAVTKKISMITGVDPRFLFNAPDQKYNAASVEAAGQDLIRFTFRARLEMIEDELSTKLLSEDEQDSEYAFKLDTSELLRGDTAVQMSIATSGVAGGILTRNEGREEVDEQPVEDPAADKLLVPTSVATESTSQEESETHAAPPPPVTYAAFQPLIADAVNRVEVKTAKALETASKKPDAERIAYTNALAETQANYAADSLSPIGDTINTITGITVDVTKIGEAYAAEIRCRAAGQPPKELSAIVGENIHE